MESNNVITVKIIRNKQEFRNIKQSADFVTSNLKNYIVSLQSIQKIVNTALTEIVDQESKLAGVNEGDETDEDANENDDSDTDGDESVTKQTSNVKRKLSLQGSLKKIKS